MSRKSTFPFTRCHKGGSIKWLDLTIAQRGLLGLLWSLGEPDSDGTESIIETAGTDAASHLTMRLNIRRDRDRKSTTRSVRELIDLGFIATSAGQVRVLAEARLANAQPTYSQRTAGTQPTYSQTHSQHTASTQPDTQANVTVENRSEHECKNDALDQKDQIRSEERAPRTRSREEQVPSQEPAPGLLPWAPKNPGHPMHAEPPQGFTEPPRPPSPRSLGIEWYCRVTGRITASCRSRPADERAFAFIGSQPEADRAQAERNIRARIEDGSDPWLAGRLSDLAADHFQHGWLKYLKGQVRPTEGPRLLPPIRADYHERKVPHPRYPEFMLCSAAEAEVIRAEMAMEQAQAVANA